jgi:hypothetical protein
MSVPCDCCVLLGRGLCHGVSFAQRQGRIKVFGAPRQRKISAPYFKQCFFRGGRSITPQPESNTTPPSPKTEITNILFYILNFSSII